MYNLNIKNVLESGDVTRFHSAVGLEKQLLSSHQWGVALLVQYIHPECSKKLLLAALTHDAHEVHTGDTPATLKWGNHDLSNLLAELEVKWEMDNGVYTELSKDERWILKLADMFEGLWFCSQQAKMGICNAKGPADAWADAIQEHLVEEGKLLPQQMAERISNLLTIMRDEFEVANESK